MTNNVDFKGMMDYLKLPRCYVNRLIESTIIDKSYQWRGTACKTLYSKKHLTRIKSLDIYKKLRKAHKEHQKLIKSTGGR